MSHSLHKKKKKKKKTQSTGRQSLVFLAIIASALPSLLATAIAARCLYLILYDALFDVVSITEEQAGVCRREDLLHGASERGYPGLGHRFHLFPNPDSKQGKNAIAISYTPQ